MLFSVLADIKPLMMHLPESFWINIAKVIGLFLAIFIGFSLSNLLASYLCSRITVIGNPSPVKNPVTVYLLSNGVHTDIVVPVKNGSVNWEDFVSRDHIKSKDLTLNYIGFGWGDRGFYLETPSWSELSFKVAFKAMFGLSKSAMHLTFHHKLKESENCRKIVMDQKDYEKLAVYLRNRFVIEDQRVVTIAGYSYGDNDAFYEATGSYSCFYTCNTWTNGALKAANQKACLWTLFDTGILKIYSK